MDFTLPTEITKMDSEMDISMSDLPDLDLNMDLDTLQQGIVLIISFSILLVSRYVVSLLNM